jgi:hypothetical protein
MITTNLSRRYIESAVFVATWMTCGWLLRLSPDAYLVLGVPLVAFFQLVVRRCPLRQLWVREPEQQSRLNWLALPVAFSLMALPAYELFMVALPQRLWIGVLWLLCGMAGGGVATFVLQSQRTGALRRALPSFGATLLVGFVIMAVSAVLNGRSPVVAWGSMPFLLKQFFLYFAVSFTLEEVVFRGALDSHVNLSGDPHGTQAWGSALFVSALWGLWHLPSVAPRSVQALVILLASLLLVHTFVGVPLSFCWRQSGTLLLPAAAHALIDAYRNTILF